MKLYKYVKIKKQLLSSDAKFDSILGTEADKN